MSDNRCANCGAPLIGDYCADCGQPRKSPIVSIAALVSDFLRDVLSLDSRAWRTLSTLMLHPGRMTADYVAGRRASYSPPVRLYLLTSLLFLAIVSFPIMVDSFRVDLDGTRTDATDATDASDRGDADPAGARGTPDDARAASSAGAEAGAPPGVPELPGTPELPDVAEVADAIPPELAQTPCDDVDLDFEGWNHPGLEAMLQERAKIACQRITGEGGGRRFLRELVENLPSMLLFLLPVMALVMVFLYPFGGRRYVEHLVLLTHYHAFVFVLVGLTIVFARLPPVLPAWGWVKGLTITFTSLYTPYYLYRSLRTVYGQGTLLTAFKFVLLVSAYTAGLLFIFVAGLLLTVWSFTG